tara:strand:- start:261 stop:575 length:315 start_codon:yes stop_codon:yes gene_type:complete
MSKLILIVAFLQMAPGESFQQSFVFKKPQFYNVPECQMFVQQNLPWVRSAINQAYGEPKALDTIYCVEADSIEDMMKKFNMSPDIDGDGQGDGYGEPETPGTSI